MNQEQKEIPAGVADPYTEMIKVRRLKQLSEENYAADEIRPVKHVKQVMIDFIKKLQEELKS